jgi:hypothetical protein
MLKFELFNLKCISDDIIWKEKKISIKKNIQYIITILDHYKFEYIKDQKDSEDLEYLEKKRKDNELPLTYSYIYTFWFNNIKKYSKIFNIDFSNLKLDTEYSIAPIYVSRNKNIDIVIIGIFLLDYNFKKNESQLFNNNSNLITPIQYRFLSKVNPLSTTRECDLKKYNVLKGVLNYYNNFKNNILDDKYLHLEKYTEKYSEKYKIPIKIILANACNYLPKVEINIIEKIDFTMCFRSRLNP